MNLIIRNAITNDIKTIQSIAKTTWAITYHFLSPEQIEYMLNWMYSTTSLQEQMQNEHQFFVAAVDGIVIGFASVSKEEKNICKLNKLYILPTIQKAGVGKALLQRVIAFAKENDRNEIQLQVNRNNNAKNFYLRQGFEILHEADFEIGNGFFMNDYVMGLKIIHQTHS
jgi:N-acetylglutamate synthase-like GNAT family acetyltransferase